jgi:hypothetical protein
MALLMDPATLLMIINGASAAIDLALRQAAILQARGDITPEQLADIRARARVSDDRFDEAVKNLTGRELIDK